MNDAIRQKVFNQFIRLEGWELYNKVLDIIDFEVNKQVTKQLSERKNFQVRMSNKVNNAGWDDKTKHSKFIDMIRDEGNKIQDVVEKFNLDE